MNAEIDTVKITMTQSDVRQLQAEFKNLLSELVQAVYERGVGITEETVRIRYAKFNDLLNTLNVMCEEEPF